MSWMPPKGTSLQSLTEVASHSGFGAPVFHAVAGTTYYLQIGRGTLFGGTAPMSFRLEQPPPPSARFGFSPFDPSVLFNSLTPPSTRPRSASRRRRGGSVTGPAGRAPSRATSTRPTETTRSRSRPRPSTAVPLRHPRCGDRIHGPPLATIGSVSRLSGVAISRLAVPVTLPVVSGVPPNKWCCARRAFAQNREMVPS